MDGLASAIKESGLTGVQVLSLLRAVGDAGGGAESLARVIHCLEDSDNVAGSEGRGSRGSMIAHDTAGRERWEGSEGAQQQAGRQAVHGAASVGGAVVGQHEDLMQELEAATRAKNLAEVDIAETTARWGLRAISLNGCCRNP